MLHPAAQWTHGQPGVGPQNMPVPVELIRVARHGPHGAGSSIFTRSLSLLSRLAAGLASARLLKSFLRKEGLFAGREKERLFTVGAFQLFVASVRWVHLFS